MSESPKDEGVIAALLQRLNTQRLPKALALKDKVDGGELLNEHDIVFLKQVFADANKISPLVERNPEYHALVGRVVNLYKETMDKAMENEKRPETR